MAAVANSWQPQPRKAPFAPPLNSSLGSLAWRQAASAWADKVVCEGYAVDFISTQAGRLRDSDESSRCWAIDLIAEVSTRLRRSAVQSRPQPQPLCLSSSMIVDPSASARTHACIGSPSSSTSRGMSVPQKASTSAPTQAKAPVNMNATSPRRLRMVPQTVRTLDGGQPQLVAPADVGRLVIAAPPPLTRSMVRLSTCQPRSRSASLEVPAGPARSMSLEVPPGGDFLTQRRRATAPSSLPTSPAKTPRTGSHAEVPRRSLAKEAEAFAKQAAILRHQIEASDPMLLVQQHLLATLMTSLCGAKDSVQRMLSWISHCGSSTGSAIARSNMVSPGRRTFEPISTCRPLQLSATVPATPIQSFIPDSARGGSLVSTQATLVIDNSLVLSATRSVPSLQPSLLADLGNLSAPEKGQGFAPTAEADFGNLSTRDKVRNCPPTAEATPDNLPANDRLQDDVPSRSVPSLQPELLANLGILSAPEKCRGLAEEEFGNLSTRHKVQSCPPCVEVSPNNLPAKVRLQDEVPTRSFSSLQPVLLADLSNSSVPERGRGVAEEAFASFSMTDKVRICPPKAEANHDTLPAKGRLQDDVPTAEGLQPTTFKASEPQAVDEPQLASSHVFVGTDGVTVFDEARWWKQASCLDSCPSSSRGTQTTLGSSRGMQTFDSAPESSRGPQSSRAPLTNDSNECLEPVALNITDISPQTSWQSHQHEQAEINLKGQSNKGTQHDMQVEVQPAGIGEWCGSDDFSAQKSLVNPVAEKTGDAEIVEDLLTTSTHEEEMPITSSYAEDMPNTTSRKSSKGPPANMEKRVTAPLAMSSRRREASTLDSRGVPSISSSVKDLSRTDSVASLHNSPMSSRNSPTPSSARHGEIAKGTLLQMRSRDAHRWIPPGRVKGSNPGYL